MLKINDLLHKYELKPLKYIKKNNAIIINTEKGSFVFKKKSDNPIYDYLNSRNFKYYPEVLSNKDDDYEITRYINSIEMPNEQKLIDMIDLVSLLHNKTTHYKSVDEDDYKKIYEDISNNIEYLYSYYNDLMTLIESKVYFSPPEYLLATNISIVYESLSFCKQEIDEWYKIVKDKKKQRLVVLHNNLSLDHYIRGDIPYLISWDKSRIDMPIFDLYKLYKRHNYEYDFDEIFKRYEKEYKLLDEERILFFILIALPDKIEFSNNNYDMCLKIGKFIEGLRNVSYFISPYYSKNTP